MLSKLKRKRKMIKAFLILGIMTSLLYYVTILRRQPEMKLVQSHVVFRHGARTPLKTPAGLPGIDCKDDVIIEPRGVHVNLVVSRGLPLDKNAEVRGGGEGCHGKLTSLGARESFMLGRKLRERYFVTSHDDVMVTSTRIERTIETARQVMSGEFFNCLYFYFCKLRLF